MATHISKKEAREADLLKVKNERTGEILKVVSPHDLVVGIADFMESDLRVTGNEHITGSLYIKNGASGTLILPDGGYALRGGASIQIVDDGDGGFTINSLAPGSVASAPKDAPYITYEASSYLSNEKVLKGSGPITFDPSTATVGFDSASSLTVNSLSANDVTVGGVAFNSIPFITTAPAPSFTGAKVLSAGSGVIVSAGASSATIAVDSTVARISGAAFTGPISATSISSTNHSSTNSTVSNLSAVSISATNASLTSVTSNKLTGSLTKLSTGADYLRAGNNISLATGSDGSVTISAPTVTGAPLDARYLLIGPGGNASLSNERVISFGAGITASDSGAGNSYTLRVMDSQVAFLTGANFSGPVTASSIHTSGQIDAAGSISAKYLTGSLTKLQSGEDYLRAGRNVILSTGSDGSITIAAETGSFMAGPFLLHHPDNNFPGALAIIEGDGIQFDEDERCGNFTISAKLAAGPGISLYSKPTREIVISSNVGNIYASSSFILASASSDFPSARTLSSSLGLRITDGGAGSKFDLRVDPLQIAYLSGSTFSGIVTSTAGFSGSLTRLSNGSSYIRGGVGILVTSASDGSITITNDGTVGDITAVNAGLGLVGGGTSGSVSLAADPLQVAFTTGSTFTGAVRFQEGLTGSLTRLFDGSDFLRAGEGISLSTGSDGSVTISNVSQFGDITDVVAGLGLLGGGTSGSVSISVDPATVAFLSGASFTGNVSFYAPTLFDNSSLFIGDVQFDSTSIFNAGLSGSLTSLVDGSAFIRAGEGINISTGSDGSVTITSTVNSITGTFQTDAPIITYSSSSLSNGKVAKAGTGIVIDSTPSGQVTFSVDPQVGGASAFISRLALNELPSGVIDGANRIFTLNRSPSDPTQLMLWLNGQLLTCGAGYDFTASSNTIMFSADSTPQIDDTVSVMYPYVESSSRYILNERVDVDVIGGIITGDLQYTPIEPRRLMLYWNGQLLSQGADKDYTISGRTIYINPELESLDPDDIFIAMYMAFSGTAYYEINEEITINYDPVSGLWKGELSHSPIPNAYPMIFMNGQLLKGGVSEDFITSGNRVVMLDDEIGGDFRFYATYEYTV